MLKELTYKDLYKESSLKDLDFKTSKDLELLNDEIIGQEKAKKSLNIGLSTDKFGYNIFCSGSNSTRKKTYLKKILENKESKNLTDLCYVYNFEDPQKPLLIELPTPLGKEFKKDIEEITNIIKNEIIKEFNLDNYNKNKQIIVNKYNNILNNLYEKYEKSFNDLYFTLIEDEKGNKTFIPFKEGKELSEEEFINLNKKEKDKILNNLNKAEILLIDLLKEEKENLIKMEEEIFELDKGIINSNLDNYINILLHKYSKYKNVDKYLSSIKEDILNNLDFLKTNENNHDKINNYIFSAYKVNLIVDNSNKIKNDKNSPPIIFVDYIDENKFFGSTVFNITGEVIFTTYHNIKPGEIDLAHNGYIIIDAYELLKNFHIWEKLKHIIKNKNHTITTTYYRDIPVNNTIEPEPIELNVKYILIGESWIYYLLSDIDPEFKNLFKIHAIFENTTNREENELNYAKFINKYCMENNIKPITKDGLCYLIELSSRLTDNKHKLILKYDFIYRIIEEADIYTDSISLKEINKETLEYIYNDIIYRNDIYTSEIDQDIKNNIIKIDINNSKIGEINGLAVMDFSDFTIGSPTKITCVTYEGNDKNLISVDQNSKMSGKIYDKSLGIVKGFLSSTFNDKIKNLNIQISFEQLYSMVDGDSATVAMVLTILSDIYKIPLKQYIAVTGSMNQKGIIQPIGGVNEKIEGFYRICKIKNIFDKQPDFIPGVLIPDTNVDNLMLSEEVRQAVKENKFKIYTMETIDDALELFFNKNIETLKNI